MAESIPCGLLSRRAHRRAQAAARRRGGLRRATTGTSLLLLLGCPASPKPQDTADTSPETAAPDTDPQDTAHTSDTDTGTRDTQETQDTADTGPPPCVYICDPTLPAWVDADCDGWGDSDLPTECGDPRGAVNEAGDCDDSRASVGPAGPELATSGRDDDCDGRGTITAVSDLPSRTLWPREGESYNQIGPAALIAMDWSADDVPDLLIANAGIVSTDGTHAGGALSVFRGPLSRDTATLYANEADTLLWGVQYDDFFQAAHLGDLDGDGYPDLLVGGGDSASESHLYVLRGPLPSGEAELSDVAQVLAAGAATSLITGDRAGDPDGDGLPGVAVVDRKADADRGEVYLFHTLGPAEQVADADTTFTTRSLYDIGTPLSPGDLDGDGVDDLVLSGDGETAFVLLADALASVGAVTVEDVGLQILRNEEHPETFYHPMQPMAVGDVNEDGQDDLAISDVWDGYVFVLDGPFGASPTVDTATDWSRVFVSNNGGVSYPEIDALARLGDWDLDGHDDLAIGNRWFVTEELRDGWMEGTPPDGAVFLVAGPVPVGVIDLERGSADRITAGYHGSGGFGGALASDGGDIDGDGAPDLVIADDPYAMYILFGGGTI